MNIPGALGGAGDVDAMLEIDAVAAFGRVGAVFTSLAEGGVGIEGVVELDLAPLLIVLLLERDEAAPTATPRVLRRSSLYCASV